MPRKTILKLPEPQRPVHECVASLKEGIIECLLVGCGGNGAQMLTKLARLDYALRQCGHPGGIHVTAFDPDLVSPSNVGRQMFSPSDVGQNKAVVLISRINSFYGLDWRAQPCLFGNLTQFMETRIPQLLITCVDTAKARREIHNLMLCADKPSSYWLDLGNNKSDGQVILGQPKGSISTLTVSNHGKLKNLSLLAREAIEAHRLPIVTEVFPELLDPKLKESNVPSCSVADALSKQSLFVNDHMASWAAELLDQLLRVGKISYHGAFINLETGRVNPLNVPMPKVEEKLTTKRKKVAA